MPKTAKILANWMIFCAKTTRKRIFWGTKTKNKENARTRGLVYSVWALKPLKTLGFTLEKTLKKVKKISKKYLH